MSTIISLYGGPGTGKSTSAAHLFALLKMEGVNAELVQEYVKQWAWEKRTPVKYDQFYFFGHQSRREYSLFNAVDVLVTDSPVSIVAYYAHAYGSPEQDNLFQKMAKLYFEMAQAEGHKHIHIWLSRVKPFDPKGRFHTEEQAKEVDIDMRNYLTKMLGLELHNFEGSAEGVLMIFNFLRSEGLL